MDADGDERLRIGLVGSTVLRSLHGRGATRAEDAQGTPAQSHTSLSILVYEDIGLRNEMDDANGAPAPLLLSEHGTNETVKAGSWP